MCCLFGMIDYGGSFTGCQKTKLLTVLATACEARGTDAGRGGLLHKRQSPRI